MPVQCEKHGMNLWSRALIHKHKLESVARMDVFACRRQQQSSDVVNFTQQNAADQWSDTRSVASATSHHSSHSGLHSQSQCLSCPDS